MKKLISVALILGAAAILSGCSSGEEKSQSSSSELDSIIQENSSVASAPTRAAEISGVVASLEGNELVIKNEVGAEKLTEEQMEQKREERQKMTQEERQALRAKELEGISTEDVKIVVPVGTPVFKTTGQATGTAVKADFSEIKKGSYLSVWMNGDQIESVKIKGAGN